MMIALIAALAAGASTTGIAGPGMAPEKFLCSSERWGYTGVIEVYSTFADAQSGRNAVRTSAVPPRDGALYISRAMGGDYGEYNAILTNWYSSTDPNHKGAGNPNNKNEGFFQMYDSDASNWQNQKAYWSPDKQTFTVEAKGMRASYPSVENPGDYARLWNAGAPQGSGESTKGTYLRYEYKFTATGLAGRASPDGLIRSTRNADEYSGNYLGIFKNESLRYPDSNGFYVVRLQFNSECWAVRQGLAENDEFASAAIRR